MNLERRFNFEVQIISGGREITSLISHRHALAANPWKAMDSAWPGGVVKAVTVIKHRRNSKDQIEFENF